MPGVVVNTGVRVGGTGAETAPSSTLFVVGTAERGRLTAYTVRSMTEFETEYGDYAGDANLHQNLQVFFEEGGIRAVVARVVGATTTKGTLVLSDASSGVTMTLAPAGFGSWSSNLQAVVTNNSTAFDLTLNLKGARIFSGTFATSAAAIAAIAAQIPHLVVATAGASSLLPATVTASLSAGTSDLNNATNTEYIAALAQFGEELGTGAVAMPGKNGAAIWTALRDHAQANKRVALASFVSSASYSAAITSASSYAGSTAAEKNANSHIAFYWPQITVPDGTGGARMLTPEVYVAAVRARQIIATGGPWKAAAGVASAARFITNLESNGGATRVSKTIGNALDEGRVNALRIIDGQIRIYGARSASGDNVNWRYITYRDSVNQISTRCEESLEQFVFSSIDTRNTLFGSVSSALVSVLEEVKNNGGLYAMVDGLGNEIDRGYSVEVSDALNPIANLATGQVVARLGVRVAGVADLITLTVTKSSLTATL